MAGMVIGWSNPLLTMSPVNRIAPLARGRLDQPKVLLLAVRWPPAPTWMAELAYTPDRVKVAPVAFIVPLAVSPKAGLFVAAAATTVPAVTFSVAPAGTGQRPGAGGNTYRWLAGATVPRGGGVAVCPAPRVPGWRMTPLNRRLLANRVASMAGMVIA